MRTSSGKTDRGQENAPRTLGHQRVQEVCTFLAYFSRENNGATLTWVRFQGSDASKSKTLCSCDKEPGGGRGADASEELTPQALVSVFAKKVSSGPGLPQKVAPEHILKTWNFGP